jgi:hypothetical protein
VGGDVGADAHAVDEADPRTERQAAAEQERGVASPPPDGLHPARTPLRRRAEGSA